MRYRRLGIDGNLTWHQFQDLRLLQHLGNIRVRDPKHDATKEELDLFWLLGTGLSYSSLVYLYIGRGWGLTVQT